MKIHWVVLVVTMTAMSVTARADTVYVPSPSELPDGWSLTVVPDSEPRGSITNRNQGGELCFQFTQGDENKTSFCWASMSTANFDGLTPGQITALNIRLYGIEGDKSWQPPKFVFAFAKSSTSLSNRFVEWIPWSDGIPQPPPPGDWQTLDALVDGSWYCPNDHTTYPTFADFATKYPTAYLADDLEIILMKDDFVGKSFNLGHANWWDNDGSGTQQYNDNNRGCVDWFELGIDGVTTKYMLNAVPVTDTGDFDGDGDVDGDDFLAWQIGFGIDSGATRADGDANDDGAVDSSDLAIWQDQFGTLSATPSAQAAAIPEPSSIAVLCIGLAVSVSIIRRIRNQVRVSHF